MHVVAEILSFAKAIPGFHVEVVNPPYQSLVIEYLHERGPRGLLTVSVAHYGEQNGDLMRDPEMVFEVEGSGSTMVFKPFYWRNDYCGVEQYSVRLEGSSVKIEPELLREHEEFAVLWNENLDQQGFLPAFRRSLAQQEP